MQGLGFSEVEAALAELHDVLPERRSAFRARIKHLQKLGFPAGLNTGKGTRAVYTLEAIAKLVAAFEFMQFGMMPATAVNLIETNWSFFRVTVAAAYIERLERGWPRNNGFAFSWVWILTPQMMADLAPPEDEQFASIGAFRLKDVEKTFWEDWRDGEDNMVPVRGRAYRLAMVNISWALDEFLSALVRPEGNLFSQEVDQWTFDQKDFDELEKDIGLEFTDFFARRLSDVDT